MALKGSLSLIHIFFSTRMVTQEPVQILLSSVKLDLDPSRCYTHTEVSDLLLQAFNDGKQVAMVVNESSTILHTREQLGGAALILKIYHNELVGTPSTAEMLHNTMEILLSESESEEDEDDYEVYDAEEFSSNGKIRPRPW